MATLKKFIRRYTSISAVIDILRRRELPLLDPQTWDDRNDRYFMNLYKSQKNIPGLYGLCAAQCSETYHHWRVFTGTADGACIEFKRQPLEESLKGQPNIRFEEVHYLLLEQVEALGTTDLEQLPFIKRVGFTAEKEYRIIAQSDEPQRTAFSIDMPLTWINKIYLNPWLPDTTSESVKATLRSFPGCSKLPVQKSRLIDSGRWKKAGDKVVGRSVPNTPLRKSKSLANLN
jgi:hypothetical protein